MGRTDRRSRIGAGHGYPRPVPRALPGRSPRAAVARRRGSRGPWALFLAAGLVVVGCIPQDKGAASEVADPGRGTAPSAPPVFPESGPVPPELLVDGIAYDLGTAPDGLRYWSPSPEQARCAATAVVDRLGATRLAELGYRPATTGASLNDIDLTPAERTLVTDVVAGCVDLADMVASLVAGPGNLTGKQAGCLADGLVRQGLARPVLESWAFGRPLDPLDGDGAFGSALLSQAAVCLPPDAFSWYDVDRAGDPLPPRDATSTTAPAPGSGSTPSTTR